MLWLALRLSQLETHITVFKLGLDVVHQGRVSSVRLMEFSLAFFKKDLCWFAFAVSFSSESGLQLEMWFAVVNLELVEGTPRIRDLHRTNVMIILH